MCKKKYCGPFWMPEWARPCNKFNEACKQHDLDYTECKKTRKQADEDFLAAMLKVCDGAGDKSIAYSYYGMVRAMGWASWGRK